jgi:hypothetical protein
MRTSQTPIAQTSLDRRAIALYLTFAYGIAWICGLIIARTGGLANSPPPIPR